MITFTCAPSAEQIGTELASEPAEFVRCLVEVVRTSKPEDVAEMRDELEGYADDVQARVIKFLTALMVPS